MAYAIFLWGQVFAAMVTAAGCGKPYIKNGLTWSKGALRMNQIQMVGTHNSYHIEPSKLERLVIAEFAPQVIDLNYTHAPLKEQLSHQHVRSLELDLLADPMGDNYVNPLVLTYLNRSHTLNKAYRGKGIKILHIPDVDVQSTCPTLVACLKIIKEWMDKHPNAVPLPIMTELKTTDPESTAIGGAKVIPWNSAGLLDDIDVEIRSVFPPEQLIQPEDIRRGNLTLSQSVTRFGWPDLESVRGRIFFLMDNGPDSLIRDKYTTGSPALEGRVLFTNALPGDADCAFQKLNNPVGISRSGFIQEQVRAGYYVRTRADETLRTVRNNCSTTMLGFAFTSGTQIVSTDFPAPGMSSRWGCDYFVELSNGRVARCNPVNSPLVCEDDKLE